MTDHEDQGVIVVQAAPGTQVLSAFGSGHIRVESGGTGRSMPGASQGNSRPPGGA